MTHLIRLTVNLANTPPNCAKNSWNFCISARPTVTAVATPVEYNWKKCIICGCFFVCIATDFANKVVYYVWFRRGNGIYSMSFFQVCTHGLVSFGLAITNINGSIPRGYGPPFIAVNWYHFHTYRNSGYNKGRVYYRSTSSGAEKLFRWVYSDIWSKLYQYFPNEVVLSCPSRSCCGLRFTPLRLWRNNSKNLSQNNQSVSLFAKQQPASETEVRSAGRPWS